MVQETTQCPVRQDMHPDPSDPRRGATAECLVQRIPKLIAFLRRRGYSQVVAEQAVDRVVRAALPHIEGIAVCELRTEKDRRRWLFRCAETAAWQIAKRQACKQVIDPEMLVNRISQASALPAEVIDAIHAALDQLTAQQREALHWCVVIDMSEREAAKKMGCSATTVRHHRDRGLVILRAHLHDLKPTPVNRHRISSAEAPF